MNGPHEADDEDDARMAGWSFRQTTAADAALWRTDSEKLLEHVRRIMSLRRHHSCATNY